ncbi:hypothetical protein ACP4OV_027989 [Aristida adscensionis]
MVTANDLAEEAAPALKFLIDGRTGWIGVVLLELYTVRGKRDPLRLRDQPPQGVKNRAQIEPDLDAPRLEGRIPEEEVGRSRCRAMLSVAVIEERRDGGVEPPIQPSQPNIGHVWFARTKNT